MIPDAARAAMQGLIPSVFATCAKDGTPNVSYVSQVYFVDDRHVAVSYQFFNKTIRNIGENPYAQFFTVDARTYALWVLDARFVREETSGPIFEEMELQLEAIASMSGMSDVFKLRAAHIYEVLAVERADLFGPEQVAAFWRK